MSKEERRKERKNKRERMITTKIVTRIIIREETRREGGNELTGLIGGEKTKARYIEQQQQKREYLRRSRLLLPPRYMTLVSSLGTATAYNGGCRDDAFYL